MLLKERECLQRGGMSTASLQVRRVQQVIIRDEAQKGPKLTIKTPRLLAY